MRPSRRFLWSPIAFPPPSGRGHPSCSLPPLGEVTHRVPSPLWERSPIVFPPPLWGRVRVGGMGLNIFDEPNHERQDRGELLRMELMAGGIENSQLGIGLPPG